MLDTVKSDYVRHTTISLQVLWSALAFLKLSNCQLCDPKNALNSCEMPETKHEDSRQLHMQNTLT